MRVTRDGGTITVDLHGMRAAQAKFRLEALIGSMDQSVRRMVVIHGYRGGDALRQLVRTGLEAPRIRRVCPSLNEGQTVLEFFDLPK